MNRPAADATMRRVYASHATLITGWPGAGLCLLRSVALVLLALCASAQPYEEPLDSTTPPIIKLQPVGDAAIPDSELAPEPAEQPEAEPPPTTAEAPEPTSVLRELQNLYEEESPDTAAAPPGTAGGSIFIDSLRTFAWLCVLCALIILGGYLLRKYGSKTPLLASPQLGDVIGRIYLNPKTTIHFVRTGDRVLLLGVTPQHVSLLTEFDAALFSDLTAGAGPGNAKPASPQLPHDFLAELQANHSRLQQSSPVEDDDLVSLRSDIQRLQQSLQEKMREGQH